MPEGGKATPLNPSLLSRATQAARYVISGVTPSTWFGPMQPLQPLAPPDTEGRRFDYPVGYNLTARPRPYEPVSFHQLRALSENCDILRSVIETRKDQMEALDWNIRLKPDDSKKNIKANAAQQKRIDAITAFFRSPDKANSWEQWLRMWLEDMFVLDAACLYKRRTRKGDLYSLEIIDGSTVSILLDDGGRRPLPPSPAYQQILKGVPATDYTSDELLYLMHNPRAHKVYGYSQVEQIIITVNTQIRRAISQLEYFREGSQPDAFMGMPSEWTTEQIVAFQAHWDGMMSGNLAERRKIKFIPDGKYQATKEPPLKDEYDEWLARVICYTFSVPPTPFIKQMNRATADSSHDAALEEGLAPLQKYVRNNLNRIIAAEFESPDLEFFWVDDREQDPAEAATIRQGDVKTGIISIDEARETIGLDPMGGAYAEPMPLTPTGFVAVKSADDQDAAAQAGLDAQQAAAEAKAKQPDNDNEQQPDAKAQKLGKGVKKKSSNPYLLIGHSHEKP